MKVELCNFSGSKIYPGAGRRYVRIDGRVFNFVDSKSRRLFLAKKNPRKISWTVLYRRQHKKGTQEEVTRRRTRKTAKFARGVQGVSFEQIMLKRNQKPEVRKAARDQALRAAKEKAKAAAVQKKAAAKAAAPAAKAAKAKVVKNVAAPKARVGGKR